METGKPREPLIPHPITAGPGLFAELCSNYAEKR
jgi:hypothetical protein